MYIAIGQKKRTEAGKEGWKQKRPLTGVEGNPEKTQITINEGDRQKGAKKDTCRKTVVTNNSECRMRVER